jgi:hypothetical protein
LEGARLRGGDDENMFNPLFTVEEVTRSDEIDLENPEDEKLKELEKELMKDQLTQIKKTSLRPSKKKSK